MKKRISKKKKIKDYREEGFQIHVEFNKNNQNLSNEQFDQEIDKFIDKIEETQLYCASGFSKENWNGWIYPNKPYQKTTSQQKQKILDYLQTLENWERIGTTANLDLNHTSEKKIEKIEKLDNSCWDWIHQSKTNS